MTAPVIIKDPETNNTARVTKYGQLVVAPISYSTAVERPLTATGTAFNFVQPLAGHKIVITAVLVAGEKSVSASVPADVRVFTAASATSATAINSIVSPQITRGSTTPLVGLNFLVDSGVWINATTDDATVFVTLAYYYIPVGGI